MNEADGMSGRASVFVVAPAEDREWGIDAALISAIVTPADWRGEVPVDAGALLRLLPGKTDGMERILLIRSGAAIADVPVLVRGRISLRTVESSRVQPLPQARLFTARAGLFCGVVLSEEHRPLMIVDAERLLAARATP